LMERAVDRHWTRILWA